MTESEQFKLTQAVTLALEELKAPVTRQRLTFQARHAYMTFTSYVNEGFTPAQALQLVIAKL